MKWVTRERPKIDRIACPWLLARFIDPRSRVPLCAGARCDARGARDRCHCQGETHNWPPQVS